MSFITQTDLAVLDFIRRHIACPALDLLFSSITALGDAGFIWILTAFMLILIKKYRKDGITAGIALLIGFILCNIILKNAVMRIRPFDLTAVSLIIPPPTDYSFPSGHTCSSFAAALVLLRVSDKRIGIPSIILACLIAVSRLYLYVHYPTDVIGGAVVGALSAYFAALLAERIPKLKDMHYSKALH